MDNLIKKLESVLTDYASAQIRLQSLLVELRADTPDQVDPREYNYHQVELLLDQARKVGMVLSKTNPLAITTILAAQGVKSLTVANAMQLVEIIKNFNEALGDQK